MCSVTREAKMRKREFLYSRRGSTHTFFLFKHTPTAHLNSFPTIKALLPGITEEGGVLGTPTKAHCCQNQSIKPATQQNTKNPANESWVPKASVVAETSDPKTSSFQLAEKASFDLILHHTLYSSDALSNDLCKGCLTQSSPQKSQEVEKMKLLLV